MTIRKGINISANYVVHHKLYAFIYVLCILKIKRSDKIVVYTVFKTQRPSQAVF